MPRSIAQQSVTELGGASSVLARQRRDHIELDGLLERVRGVSGPEQDAVLQRINRLVFPHAFAEEAVLWPAARRALPDGPDLTLRVESEHQEINELVTELERTRPGEARRAQVLDRLIPLLRQDVRDEEDLLLPRLQEVLDVRTLRRLGTAWELVRRVAPTRPHPVVARRPPGNTLSALPLTVLDRSRDRLDRIARRPGRAATAGALLSLRLRALTGRIERFGPLRRGEDRRTRAYGAGETP